MLGTYDKQMSPFYLDDSTGKVLIDPVQKGVELRRSLISALTTFFGCRSFDILLNARTQRLAWNEQRYSLNEGDRV